jgi:transcriptional regulator with XRE-family HTH domain
MHIDRVETLIDAVRVILRETREDRKISRADLVRGIRCSVDKINDYENFKGGPTINTLENVCRFLNIKPSEVFFRAENRLRNDKRASDR